MDKIDVILEAWQVEEGDQVVITRDGIEEYVQVTGVDAVDADSNEMAVYALSHTTGDNEIYFVDPDDEFPMWSY